MTYMIDGPSDPTRGAETDTTDWSGLLHQPTPIGIVKGFLAAALFAFLAVTVWGLAIWKLTELI